MRALVIAMSVAGLVASLAQVSAAPVEYVRVCSVYGAGYYYIPGTDTCLNADTQETRRQTAFGTEIGKTSFARGVDERIDKAFEASAIANALQSPDLVAGERFGIRVNWGAVETAHAIGLTSAVVINDGLFDGGNGRIVGSFGLGYSGSTVGGNAGLQLSW